MWVWGSRLLSLLVWLWWCHCLGHALAERAHAIHLFSTVSFTEKSEELGGFDSTCIFPIHLLPHCCPLPLPVCHILTPVFSHTHCDHFFTLLLTIMSSSIFILLQCHKPDDDSSAWTADKICMYIFIFESSACLSVQRKKINWGQQQPVRNQYPYGHAGEETAVIINLS